ncbi:S8 family serine peptidase [Tessaracoccus sp. Y36]
MFQQRWWRTAMTSLVVAALALSPAVSRADDEAPAPVNLGNLADYVTNPAADLGRTRPTGEWFVEFRSQPTASGGRQTQLQRNRSDFTAEARAASLPAEVGRIYTRLFNGVTVKADDAQARKLAGLRSVKSVHPVLAMRVPAAPPSAEGSATRPTLAMIGADRAQSELGATGRGVKVGIIDSGIDYAHPDLGGTGSETTTFPTERVAYGWDFIGDDWTSFPDEFGEVGEITPDGDPMDCLGHGTHVAGTVGGAGDVVGVAPEATLGAYKVLTCSGDTTMAIVLDAMERATADGMDVVNMSLGWPLQSSANHPLSQAGDRMVDAGVVLVVAAGNEGEFGTQTLRAPSVAAKAISVASFDATSISTPEVVFTPAAGEAIRSGYTVVSEAPVPTGFTGELATFSDPLQCKPDPTLAGKVAFFSGDGGCDIERRTQLALQSGAIGVVLHKQYFWDWVWSDGAPVIGILSDAGRQVQAALEQGPVTVTVPGTFIDDPNPYTPGLASVFTSWGLDAELGLKPDLGAPGGNVYSTMPLAMGGHALMSGTSMASPHVAGAAALLLQGDPAATPAEVRTRLQNTATPAAFSFMPESGVLDGAHRQGAGLIHVDRAITQQHLVTPSKLATGQSADGPFRQTLTLTNATDAAVTWTATHQDAVTTSVAWGESRLQNRPDFTQEQAQVTFSSPTITVPAGGSATVDVTIDAPEAAAETAIYSGYLRFTTEGHSIQVPFAGMKGDYSAAPLVLGDDSQSPPFLGVLWDCLQREGRLCVDMTPSFSPVEEPMPYNEWALPAVGFLLATPASSVTLSVLAVDAAGAPIEASAQEVYTERTPWRSPDGNSAAWDGLLIDADGELVPAPQGQYVLRIRVTNSDLPARTEVWTSPAFQWLDEPTEEPEPSPTPTKKPTTAAPKPEVRDVYNTPGLHMVNGRQWFTACEPYSQTVRCRTMIMATTVTAKAGVFTQTNGWVFNNLTYLPRMTRAQWGTNPLARNGAWTSADGRRWRTECDTAATGRGGCRTYLSASVIAALPTAAGGTQYTWVTKEILNNIVRFR